MTLQNLPAKPEQKCYLDAIKYKAVQYQRVPQILNQMKGCLASGYPFVFGFSVYTEFESAAAADCVEKLSKYFAILRLNFDVIFFCCSRRFARSDLTIQLPQLAFKPELIPPSVLQVPAI